MTEPENTLVKIICCQKFEAEAPSFPLLVKGLKKNKISLIEVYENNKKAGVTNPFFNSPDFTNALNEEKAHLAAWHRDFLLIKTQWDKENIDYIFHKSVGSFPYMSDNLDVLVRTTDFKKAGQILTQLNYVSLRNIQEAHKEFYRKFNADKSFVPMHLHERVCWVVPYENIDHLWKNYVQATHDPIVFHPSPDDSVLILTAHCFLEDHVVKFFDILFVKKNINPNTDYEYIYRTAQEMHWAKSLHTAFIIFQHLYMQLFNEPLFPEKVIDRAWKEIEDSKWISNKLKNDILKRNIEMPFKIPHLWTRQHTALRELNDPSFGNIFQRLYQIFSGLADRFIHLKLKMKNHPGCFISFSGIDGSGKSSHIKALHNAFSTCEIKSRVIWGRAGSTPLISLILKFRRLFTNSKSADKTTSPSTQQYKSPLSLWFWRKLNVLDLILFCFFKATLPKLSGKVVIADRFIYDSIIDMEALSKTPRYNRLSYKILKWFTPTPDVALYIDVNPQEVYKRLKDQVIKEDLNKEYQAYKVILPLMNPKIYNNNTAFSQVSEQVIADTLSAFFSKYPEKYRDYKTVSFRYK